MEEELFDEMNVLHDAERLLPRASMPRARGLPVAAGLLAFSMFVYVGGTGFFGRVDGGPLLAPLALHSEGVSLSFETCAEYDDDAYYPADQLGGETCFQQDIDTSCFMLDLPQYAAFKKNCAGTCGDDAWSNLCSWQAIRDLPDTCAGTFAQAPPDPALHGGRNRGPRSPGGQVDYDDTNANLVKAGDGCGAHSYCATCYDDDGNLSPYCDAVQRFYAASHGIDKIWKTGIYFWRSTDLDFWCSDDVQREIANFAREDPTDTEPIELRLLALAPEALRNEPYKAHWVPPGDDVVTWLAAQQ